MKKIDDRIFPKHYCWDYFIHIWNLGESSCHENYSKIIHSHLVIRL